MELKLNDGTTIQVSEQSTQHNIMKEYKKFADIDKDTVLFTNENLVHIVLNGTHYDNLIYTGMNIAIDNDTIFVSWTTRDMTLEETNAMQITELQEAVAELVGFAGGGVVEEV